LKNSVPPGCDWQGIERPTFATSRLLTARADVGGRARYERSIPYTSTHRARVKFTRIKLRPGLGAIGEAALSSRTSVGFGGVDASNTRHDAVKETIRCVEKLGLKGIFIEPGRQLLSHPADERLKPVYEACISLHVAVVLMSAPYAGADINASTPIYVDRLATS
jgi:hypothetical protein